MLSLSPSVLYRFGKWFVIASLVLSIGGHWAVLQTVAWVGMAVSYCHESSFSDGLSKTFDGKHPCKLCKMVREGKKTENKQETDFDLKKEFFKEEKTVFYFEPRPFLSVPLTPSFAFRSETPPVPPPLAA